MPTFKITAPDGKVYRVTGENAEGALAAVQAMGGQGGQPAATDGPFAAGDPRNEYLRRARERVESGGPREPASAGHFELGAQRRGSGDAAAAGLLDTLTLGTADELAAGIEFGLNQLPGGNGRSYGETLTKVRGELGQAQGDNPGSYLGGQLVGGIGQGVGLARAGLSAGANAARAGGSLKRVAGASAVDGAVLGGLYGAGSGEGTEGRVFSAGMGALGGGALGGVAPYAVAGVGAAAKPLVATVASRLQPKRYADMAVSDGLRRAGMSAEDVARQLEDATAEGQSMFSVSDALGHSGRRLASTVARTPHDERQRFVDFLNGRQDDQAQRVSQFLSEGLSAPYTAQRTQRVLKDARGAAADSNYGAARGSAMPVDVGEAIRRADAFLKPGISGIATPQSNIRDDSIEATIRWARSLLTDGQSQLTDFNSVFRAKRELDNILKKNQGTPLAAELKPIQQAVDDALAAASGPYSFARDEFRRQSKIIEGLDKGSEAARGVQRLEDTTDAFARLSPDEQATFRVGYGDSLISRVQSTPGEGTNRARPFTSLRSREELAAFERPGGKGQLGRQLGRENTMFETRNAALGGSKTAENLADAAEMNRFDPGVMMALFRGRPDQAVIQAVTNMINETKGMSPRVVERVARTLMETRPDVVRKILSDAMKTRSKSDGKRALANTILVALSSSVPGRLASP